MKEAFDKLFQTKMKNPVTQIRIRKMKNLVLLFFVAGFFCFLILGARFVDDLSLLDSASLMRIRDVGVDKNDFFGYLCVSHLILFILFGFFWWYQWGKVCVYVWIAFGALKLGICLSIALIRYHLKGIVLWLILYLPHTFFYFLALFWGVMLCQNVNQKYTEKLRFLLQNIVLVMGVLISWALGIYLECYVSSDILKNYLQYF